jgi:hypothetical protein
VNHNDEHTAHFYEEPIEIIIKQINLIHLNRHQDFQELGFKYH